MVAVGETTDKIVGTGKLCGTDAVLIGGVETTIANIVHNRSGKEIDILQDHAERPPE